MTDTRYSFASPRESLRDFRAADRDSLSTVNKKIIFISFLGTSLEFYDFTLYGIFASAIATHFFPAENEMLSLLAAFGAFAAGFVFSPTLAAMLLPPTKSSRHEAHWLIALQR